MFSDRVLKYIFGPKKEEVTGEELHGFYLPEYYFGDEL
jgi:hypothetical protein